MGRIFLQSDSSSDEDDGGNEGAVPVPDHVVGASTAHAFPPLDTSTRQNVQKKPCTPPASDEDDDVEDDDVEDEEEGDDTSLAQRAFEHVYTSNKDQLYVLFSDFMQNRAYDEKVHLDEVVAALKDRINLSSIDLSCALLAMTHDKPLPAGIVYLPAKKTYINKKCPPGFTVSPSIPIRNPATAFSVALDHKMEVLAAAKRAEAAAFLASTASASSLAASSALVPLSTAVVPAGPKQKRQERKTVFPTVSVLQKATIVGSHAAASFGKTVDEVLNGGSGLEKQALVKEMKICVKRWMKEAKSGQYIYGSIHIAILERYNKGSRKADSYFKHGDFVTDTQKKLWEHIMKL